MLPPYLTVVYTTPQVSAYKFSRTHVGEIHVY
nr:MAG TPA: hypothetical protein [Bacteriophage sp.]